MAIVPRRTGKVQQERGPVVFQSAAGATPEAFGAGVSKTVSRLAEVQVKKLTEANARIQRREDAISRLESGGVLSEQLAETRDKEVQEGGGLETTESVANLRDANQAAFDASISNYRGSDPLVYQAEALAQLNAANDSAVTDGITTQNAKANRLAGEQVSILSSEVGQNPSKLTDNLARAETVYDSLIDALSPEAEAVGRASARTQITSSAIENYMAVGDYDTASNLVADNARVLGAAAAGFNTRIATAQATVAKKQAAKQAEIGFMESSLDRKLTDAELQRHFNIDAPVGALTLEGKIANFERSMSNALGASYQATTQDVQKLSGAFVAEAGEDVGDFGNSFRGRALNILIGDVEAFAAGTLGPNGDTRFLAAYGAATAVDPITQTKVAAPPAVMQALRQRGFSVDPNTGAIIGGIPAITTPRALDSPDVAPVTEVPVVEGEVIEPQTQALLEGTAGGFGSSGQTAFDMAEEATGPLAAGARILGATPIIGTGSRARQVQNQLRPFLLGAAAVLARGREGDAQTIRILETFDLDPAIFSNARDFQDKVVGLVTGLDTLGDLDRTILQSTTSAEKRKETLDRLVLIESIKSKLSPPILPRTEDPMALDKLIFQFAEENDAGTRFVIIEPSTNRPMVLTVPSKDIDLKALLGEGGESN